MLRRAIPITLALLATQLSTIRDAWPCECAAYLVLSIDGSTGLCSSVPAATPEAQQFARSLRDQ